MKPAEFSYTRASTLQDAIGSLKSVAAAGRVIAGGQSLGPMLNLRLAQPKELIDISQLRELRQAKIEGDVLAIGACVTHAQIEDGDIVDVTLGLMPFVAQGIAYRAVRNRGTIGGSIAHADPAADWLTTTMALDASLRLSGAAGRREMKISDFIKGAMDTAIGDDEIITHVLRPRLSPAARWGHAKYAKKLGDFAQSMAVAVVDPNRRLARIVLGQRAESPALMRSISALLAEKGYAPPPAALSVAIEADLTAVRADRGDWTMHSAILARAVQDLMA
jgi:aerobic carbon-monoxide dehydrogenase medium subunit